MWEIKSQDYPEDAPWMREKVESGQGIIGLEMHERNGWQETLHYETPKKNTGLFNTLKKWLKKEHG